MVDVGLAVLLSGDLTLDDCLFEELHSSSHAGTIEKSKCFCFLMAFLLSRDLFPGIEDARESEQLSLFFNPLTKGIQFPIFHALLQLFSLETLSYHPIHVPLCFCVTLKHLKYVCHLILEHFLSESRNGYLLR